MIRSSLVHSRRIIAVVSLAAMLGLVAFVGAAWAAYDYQYYYNPTTPDGSGGADLDMLYRNYNDSCNGDGYAWVKSRYTLSDGSWIASVDDYAACGTNKAHLGPSTNYGYTYLQSKCINIHGSSIFLICNTTRP